MSKNKKDGIDVIVTTATIELRFTSQEAEEVIKRPNGKVAKTLRKYLYDVLKSSARKCLEEVKKQKEEKLKFEEM